MVHQPRLRLRRAATATTITTLALAALPACYSGPAQPAPPPLTPAERDFDALRARQRQRADLRAAFADALARADVPAAQRRIADLAALGRPIDAFDAFRWRAELALARGDIPRAESALAAAARLAPPVDPSGGPTDPTSPAPAQSPPTLDDVHPSHAAELLFQQARLAHLHTRDRTLALQRYDAFLAAAEQTGVDPAMLETAIVDSAALLADVQRGQDAAARVDDAIAAGRITATPLPTLRARQILWLDASGQRAEAARRADAYLADHGHQADPATLEVALVRAASLTRPDECPRRLELLRSAAAKLESARAAGALPPRAAAALQRRAAVLTLASVPCASEADRAAARATVDAIDRALASPAPTPPSAP